MSTIQEDTIARKDTWHQSHKANKRKGVQEVFGKNQRLFRCRCCVDDWTRYQEARYHSTRAHLKWAWDKISWGIWCRSTHIKIVHDCCISDSIELQKLSITRNYCSLCQVPSFVKLPSVCRVKSYLVYAEWVFKCWVTLLMSNINILDVISTQDDLRNLSQFFH